MKDELLLVQNFKKTIFYIEKIIDNFPRSEKVLKDKIKSTNFDILELISRVNARARRQIKKENYNIRNISFDATNNNFLLNNEVIHFTNSEFKIFHLLFKRKGEPVTRDEFFSMLWGSEKSYETRILDMHIKEIRKKIGKDNADLIQTIYGVGYKMKNE